MTTLSTLPTETDQRVRVTIEGHARIVSRDGNALRVAADGDGGVILLDTRSPGVTVEHVAEPWTWTDGDVVQQETAGWTLTRFRGDWVSSRLGWEKRVGYWTDELVSRHMVDEGNGWGRLVPLRCQANPERVGA